MASQHDLIILIPIYQPQLSPLEQFSVSHSLRQLKAGRQVAFIGPVGLDLSAYERLYPGIPCIRFPEACFSSIKGYNRLLMSTAFYEHFKAFEFMLVLQTDAILLRDELDQWTSAPFDYVGAPWPDGLELQFNLDRFASAPPKRLKVHVGNGGLSLRRNQACIDLLQEFPQAQNYFIQSGSSEDLFFSFTGAVSQRFLIPNETRASLFSLELKPRMYFEMNQDQAPMGGHAWWKYEPQFWQEQLGQAGTAVASLMPTRPTDAIPAA